MAKQIRVDDEIYPEIEKHAKKMRTSATAMANNLLEQGLLSVAKNGFMVPEPTTELPPVDRDIIYKEALKAAKKGTETLRKWLRGITAQEEQAIKYDIKPLKATAAGVDLDKAKKDAAAHFPDAVKKGDKICNGGVVKLDTWFNGLHKHAQDLLKQHYKVWRKDAGISDKIYNESGARPKQRYSVTLKQRGGEKEPSPEQLEAEAAAALR